MYTIDIWSSISISVLFFLFTESTSQSEHGSHIAPLHLHHAYRQCSYAQVSYARAYMFLSLHCFQHALHSFALHCTAHILACKHFLASLSASEEKKRTAISASQASGHRSHGYFSLVRAVSHTPLHAGQPRKQQSPCTVCSTTYYGFTSTQHL